MEATDIQFPSGTVYRISTRQIHGLKCNSEPFTKKPLHLARYLFNWMCFWASFAGNWTKYYGKMHKSSTHKTTNLSVSYVALSANFICFINIININILSVYSTGWSTVAIFRRDHVSLRDSLIQWFNNLCFSRQLNRTVCCMGVWLMSGCALNSSGKWTRSILNSFNIRSPPPNCHCFHLPTIVLPFRRFFYNAPSRAPPRRHPSIHSSVPAYTLAQNTRVHGVHRRLCAGLCRLCVCMYVCKRFDCKSTAQTKTHTPRKPNIARDVRQCAQNETHGTRGWAANEKYKYIAKTKRRRRWWWCWCLQG